MKSVESRVVEIAEENGKLEISLSFLPARSQPERVWLFNDLVPLQGLSSWLTSGMHEIGLELRIAFQSLIWERYKIPVPFQELLLGQFFERHSSDFPKSVAEIPEFVQKTYSKFLEPLPGLVRSRAYMDEELEKKNINLEPVPGADNYFFDPSNKMYWSRRFDPKDTPWGFIFEGPTLIAPKGRT